MKKILECFKRQFLIILFLIGLISSFFIKSSFWEDLIDKVLVDPIMSKFSQEGIYLLLVTFALLIYYGLVIKYERRIYVVRLSIVSIVLFSYLLCFYSGSWTYDTFTLCGISISYSHILLAPAIGEALFSIILFIRAHKKKTKYEGLEFDLAKKSSKESDPYNRNSYVDSLIERISKSFSKEGSFAIGIAGNWGTGKTSFANILKEKIEPKVNVVFEYKPWFCNSHGDIVKDFFNLYIQNMSLYVPALSSIIPKYIKALTETDGVKYGKMFNLIFNESFTKDPQSHYDKIKRILENSNIKVVIIIDDLDRLDKNEVLEVLRLIRNSANFPNTLFITTYDKEYVLNSLSNNGISNATQYLQKIFNLEILLPKFEERIICKELGDRLKIILESINCKDNIADIIKEISFASYGDESEYKLNSVYTIPKILPTLRDVIRFSNALTLNIEPFKNKLDEINIRDFINLELIRYGFPEIYEILKNSPLTILELDIDTKFYKYNLKLTKDDQHIKENSSLNAFLSENNKKYDIDEYLNVLFPGYSEDILSNLSHFSSYFKYFAYRLDIKAISIAEFISAFDDKNTLAKNEKWSNDKNEEEIYDKLLECFKYLSWKDESGKAKLPFDKVYKHTKTLLTSTNERLVREVLRATEKHLKSFSINSYEHFKSFVRLWSDVLIINETYNLYFNNANFLFSLLYKDNLSMHIREIIHELDTKDIKEILLGSESSAIISPLLSDFIKNHSASQIDDVKLIISINELKDIRYLYLEKYIETHSEVDESGMILLRECIESIDPITYDIYIQNNALEVMRKFIQEHPAGYISLFIKPKDFTSEDLKTIYPEPFWKQLFTTTDKFERFINNADKNAIPEIRKVRNYWQLYKNNNYNPIGFNRQGNVQVMIDNDFVDQIKELDKLIAIKEELTIIIDRNKDKKNSHEEKIEQTKNLDERLKQVNLNLSLKTEISKMLDSLKPF